MSDLFQEMVRDRGSILGQLADSLGTEIAFKGKNGSRFGNSTISGDREYPVRARGQVWGWAIGNEKAEAIAVVLSDAIAGELERRSLREDLLDKERELDLFHEIYTQINSSLDVKEVAQLVIEEAGKLLPSTSGCILLLDRETGKLEAFAEFGQSDPYREPMRFGQGIIGSVVESGIGKIVNDANNHPHFIPRATPIHSLICVPLEINNRAIGAIDISSEIEVNYTEDDLKLLTMFASQAAAAIEKARTYERSRTAADRANKHARELQRTLTELQETQAQLIQSEKMSSLGQLVAGVAHEINNPVNFISGNLTYAEEYLSDILELLERYRNRYPDEEFQDFAEEIDIDYALEDLPKLLSSMRVGVNRICQIIASLRNFSRSDRLGMELVDLRQGLEGTLLILHNRIKHGNIRIIEEYGELPLVSCYVGQLNQVFMNVIGNAIDALEMRDRDRNGNARIQPTIWICTQILDDRWAVVRIRDNGPGMSEAVKAQLFDRYFTTKPVGKGTGLGLSISYKIVTEKHGGILKCISAPGEGAEFWIQIPLYPYCTAQVPASEPIVETTSGRC